MMERALDGKWDTWGSVLPFLLITYPYSTGKTICPLWACFLSNEMKALSWYFRMVLQPDESISVKGKGDPCEAIEAD